MILRARHQQFIFPRPAMIMGVVNVTPDSFSDGGQFLSVGAAVDHALKLAEEGAEIIDIGGESTRPGAHPVSETEELRRVLPVLEKLSARTGALVSIDTYKPTVAREAVAAGAGMINDIAANRDDPAMWRVVAETGAAYVLMHMQGTPQTMQLDPVYADVTQEIGSFFDDRLKRLAHWGVSSEQTVLDVGIGFGKRREHNLELLARLTAFGRFARPAMVGVSRKSFLGGRSGAGPQDRLPAALAVACWAVQAGVHIVRTHDVKATLEAVRMTEELWENRKPEGLSL
jgi:dihydropteroate synthase